LNLGFPPSGYPSYAEPHSAHPLARFWFQSPEDSRTLFSFHLANRPRAFFSLCAASLAVVLCILQNHFTLFLTEDSFLLMTRHRCSWVLMFTTAWCLVETTRLAFRRR
jgi:hypothetical protein